jgi:hypothetical protein
MSKKLFNQKLIYILFFCVLSVGLFQCTQKKEEPVKESGPQIIVSKVEGGDWNKVTTWVEGIIPTIDSDVNITGKVIVTGKAECLNLMVDIGATLEVSPKAVLNVKHHVINDGTIINNGEIKVNDSAKK